MDSEVTNQINTSENEDDQRNQILTEMASNKENEAKIKEFIEQQQNLIKEKSNFLNEKQLMNNEIKVKLEKEMKQRNELVNLLTTLNSSMNNNIENFNLLGNVMQSFVNDHNKVENLKEDVLELLDKLKQENYEKENNHNKELNDLKDLHQQIKEDHKKNIEIFSLMDLNLLKEIEQKKENIKTNKIEIDSLDKNNDESTEEIKNIENKIMVLLNKIPELEKIYHDILNEQDVERSKNKQRILNVETELNEKRENNTKKQMEIENFQDGLKYKTEYSASLLTRKENVAENDEKLKDNILEMSKNIEEINIEIVKETENRKTETENQTRELEIIEEKINKLENNDKNNKTTLEMLENEKIEFSNNLSIIETDVLNAQKEIDQLQKLLEDQSLKFEAEIVSLEKNLNEEIQKENAVDEDNLKKEQILQEMKIKHEEMLQIEATITELDVEAIQAEMDTNLMKDEIKEIKQEIENDRQEISNRKHEIQLKQEKLEKDYDNKVKNLTSHFEKLKLKLSTQHQNILNKNPIELEKINDTKTTLNLQISEMTVSTQILQNELNKKIKELKEMKNNLDNQNEKESAKRKDPNNREFKIPATKIPTSKYSSTSDDSMDERLTIKKRKMNIKRRVEKKTVPQKPTQQQFEKMSVENILNSINSPTPKRSTRKKTIKKPVY